MSTEPRGRDVDTEQVEQGRADGLSWKEVLGRWPVVLGVAALCTLLGGLVALQQGNTYTSTTTVLVNPLDGSPFSPGTRGQNLANLRTEAQLIASDSVAAIARRTLKTAAGTDTLAQHVSVVNPANTQVLEVSFDDATPEAARAGSAAFAQAYLTFRERRAADNTQARIARLDAAITANEGALGRATAAVAAAAAGTPARALAGQKVQAASNELSKLENQVGDLRLFQTDPGQVLSPATVPTAASGLPSWAYLAAGAALGVLLGLALAAARALRDDRVRGVPDIEERGFGVLGVVAPQSGADAVLTDPTAPLPDDVRVLRTVLGAVVRPGPGARPGANSPVTLVLSNVSPRAADATWLELAAALVRTGDRVALVDAAGGSLTRTAGAQPGPGLSDFLTGDADASAVIRHPQYHLAFVACGNVPADARDPLLSPRMRDLVLELGERADWVLLAAGPSGTPEMLGLAGVAGRAVLAVELGETTGSRLRRTAADVARCGAAVVGVVVVDPARAPGEQRRPRPEAVGQPPEPAAVAPGREERAEPVDDRST
jgi:Mrp family chromosome partitioning ATPase/capsular polysaccharide biosynthesis protein